MSSQKFWKTEKKSQYFIQVHILDLYSDGPENIKFSDCFNNIPYHLNLTRAQVSGI